MRSLVATITIATAIAGCAETRHCEAEHSWRGGQCLPVPEASVPGQDGGPDGAMPDDVGVDGGHDAGPCGESCRAPRHCLETRTDGGADVGPLPTCVDCIVDDECSLTPVDGGVLICRNYRCAPGCRNAGDCGSNVCRADRTCSAYATGRDVCETCDTDANCLSGACVHFDNAGHPGAYCLSPTSVAACAGRRRFTMTLMSVPTVDGSALDDYCIPSNDITCEAVLAAFTQTCPVPSMCPASGTCVGTTCTYQCDPVRPNDCPTGHTCPSATSLCM